MKFLSNTRIVQRLMAGERVTHTICGMDQNTQLSAAPVAEAAAAGQELTPTSPSRAWRGGSNTAS